MKLDNILKKDSLNCNGINKNNNSPDSISKKILGIFAGLGLIYAVNTANLEKDYQTNMLAITQSQAYADEKLAIEYYKEGFKAYKERNFSKSLEFYLKSKKEFEKHELYNTPNYAAVLSEIIDSTFFLYEQGKKNKNDLKKVRELGLIALKITEPLLDSNPHYLCSIGGVYSQITAIDIVLGNKKNAIYNGEKAIDFCPSNPTFQKNYKLAKEM
jgi:hypothetical protein